MAVGQNLSVWFPGGGLYGSLSCLLTVYHQDALMLEISLIQSQDLGSYMYTTADKREKTIVLGYATNYVTI